MVCFFYDCSIGTPSASRITAAPSAASAMLSCSSALAGGAIPESFIVQTFRKSFEKVEKSA